MKKYFTEFTNSFRYRYSKNQEINFDLDEEEDLTDEIEKSLLEIKKSWNIPLDEINAAIESRKLSKRNAKQ